MLAGHAVSRLRMRRYRRRRHVISFIIVTRLFRAVYRRGKMPEVGFAIFPDFRLVKIWGGFALLRLCATALHFRP